MEVRSGLDDEAVVRNLSGSAAKPGPRRFILVAAGLLVIAAVVLIFRPGGRERVVPGEGLNVLLITLDTTRADRLGAYGYKEGRTPNLDELARKGVRFAHAYCQVPMTLPSHASILTGLNPFNHGVHNNGTYALGPGYTTLAEILKGRGYKTAAFTASFSVDSRFGLDQGFDVYDDTFRQDSPFKGLNSERRAEEVYASFAAWLESAGRGPFFAWVHFFDPHLPYDPPAAYLKEFPDRPYDGEVAYMDHYVGEVLRLLASKDLLGRTLVVAAGDHGEAFGEKGEYGHGIFIYEPSVHVPLIFVAENRLPAGTVVESRARLIDILPTVLDLVGIPAEGRIDGRSLVSRIDGRANSELDAYLESFYPRENHGWSELTGLISGGLKYIQAPRPELFDLRKDPEEGTDLAKTEVRQAGEMRGKLEETLRNAAGTASGGRALTAEDEERLRSLGYVQFAGGGSRGNLPDPKDKVDEMELYRTAQRYESEGDFRGAEGVYSELLSLYPAVPASYINLALAQAGQKEFDAAIATLKKGAAAVPGSDILLARLGHTYLVAGRPAEALETMKKVLEINPLYLDAMVASALILEGSGRADEARGFMERALAVEPENKILRASYARNLASSGRIPQAIEVYSRLVRDFPSDAIFLRNLGIAYGISGDYARAIENLNRAIALEPAAVSYFNLAVAFRETGRIDEAIQALERYVDFPGNEDEAGLKNARAELERLKARTIKR